MLLKVLIEPLLFDSMRNSRKESYLKISKIINKDVNDIITYYLHSKDTVLYVIVMEHRVTYQVQIYRMLKMDILLEHYGI